jgi:hypothetical protein
VQSRLSTGIFGKNAADIPASSSRRRMSYVRYDGAKRRGQLRHRWICIVMAQRRTSAGKWSSLPYLREGAENA